LVEYQIAHKVLDIRIAAMHHHRLEITWEHRLCRHGGDGVTANKAARYPKITAKLHVRIGPMLQEYAKTCQLVVGEGPQQRGHVILAPRIDVRSSCNPLLDLGDLLRLDRAA
ncbi:MAG: hypothetical protein ACK56I_28970, partial [bacterium]